MITVLSMSPAIDKRMGFHAFHVGATNRAVSVHAEGAGKGIDVALACQALGLPVACIGLLAGGGEAVTERLTRNGVNHSFLCAPGSVRTNLKLHHLDTGEITEVNEMSPPAPEALLAAASSEAVAAAGSSRFLVLTGSLPAACPPGFYADIIHRAKTEAPACRCVLDADGERLMLGIKAGAWLVKPNLAELEQAVGRALSSRAEILAAARELLALGASCVVVSMGSQGALAVWGDEVWAAPAVDIQVKTTTGAGDAMVAGLLYGFNQGGSLEGMLRCGIAAAAARCVYGGDAFLDQAAFGGFLGKAEAQKWRDAK